MSSELPPVAASVLADAVEALSPRLRGRLDGTAAKAAAWPVTLDDEGRATVHVDDETTVVLTPDEGAVRVASDAVCSCLLAPACLHRTAVLGIAPPFEESADEPVGQSAPTAPESVAAPTTPSNTASSKASKASKASKTASGTEPAAEPAGSAESPALRALQAAAEELVTAGLVGSGLAAEATLRRAVHAARADGLHRPAALGSRVAAQLRSFRTRSPEHRLADYTDDLRALMEVVRGLMTTTDPELAASLRGVGRRSHEHQGGLRLTGLFSEPVIANTGMAGVVTYTASSDGALWSVPAVTPGGPERVQAAYRGPVGLGGAALDHRELVRGGLVVSGAASSADGSLSHGKGVRSVRSSGATWWEPPLDKLFATPPTDQLERIFTGSERQRRTSAAADVLFCEITVLPTAAATRAPGSRPGDVPVHLGGGAEQSSGMVVLLRAASDHDTLAYAHNLSVLSQAPGLRLRLAARPDPIRVGVLYALAAAPDPAQAALHLPEPWHSRICLGLDHLHDSMIRASTMPTSPPDDGPAPEGIDLPPGLAHFAAHIPLHLLRAAVERVAAGGRATARATPTHRETARLRAAGLPNAAAALDRLTRTAAAAERDAYARPIPSAVSDFAEAWLAAGLYEAAASAELTVHGWRGVSVSYGGTRPPPPEARP